MSLFVGSITDPIHQQTIRLVWKLIRDRKLLISWLVVGAVISALMEGGSIGLLIVIASVIIDSDLNSLRDQLGQIGEYLPDKLFSFSPEQIGLAAILLVVSAQLIKILMSYVIQLNTINLQKSLSDELQGALVDQVFRSPYAKIVGYPPGRLTAFLALTGCFQSLVGLGITVLTTFLLGITYLASMIVISPAMTGIVVILGLVASFGFSPFIKEIGRKGGLEAKQKAKREGATVELFSHPRTIRLLQGERYAAEKIGAKRRRLLETAKRKQVLNARIPLFIQSVTIVGAGLTLSAALLFYFGDERVGMASILVFLVILNRLVPQLRVFTEIRGKVASDLNGGRHVTEFINSGLGNSLDPCGVPPDDLLRSIVFDSVVFRYPGETRHALTNICFEIPSRSTVAIIGPSGAGKTSISELILKLHQPSRGQIWINNKNLAEIDTELWRGKVSVVDQKSALFNLSIEENITFPATKVDYKKVREAARKANVNLFIDSLDEGYATILGTNGYTVSAGEKQRLLLARAIYRDPQLLIMDEATNSVDPDSEAAIQNSLREISGGCSIVIIAHTPRAVQTANIVYYLKGGKIIESGPLQTMIKKNGAIGKWWRDRPTRTLT